MDLTYKETGLFYEQFEELLTAVGPSLKLPCAVSSPRRIVSASLAPATRLLLLLCYFREAGTFRRLVNIFHVSKAFISRDIAHILPKLHCVLDSIRWPDQWIPSHFKATSAAIDCTPHFRRRVHPQQGDWYRGDKHGHFMNAQVVCSLRGEIYNVQLLQGHNNDQGCFNITKVKQLLEALQLHWLADNGYSHHRLVVPDDSQAPSWNHKQKGLRSIVEVVIGLAKTNRIAAEVFTLSPEKQALVLMVIYQLTNMSLKRYPLRRLSTINE